MSKTPPLHPDWIAPRRTALVLVDFQVEFGAPEGAAARGGADIGPAQAALARAQTLTDAARETGVPVVFVRLVIRPQDESRVIREGRQRYGGHPPPCREGTHSTDFIGPQPRGDELVVTKTRFSGFGGTQLDRLLHERGIDTLVLAGLTTECCVQATAWDAFQRDFHVFIAADACAAYEEDLHRGALKALEMSGAMVAETTEFVALWQKTV
jgi:ureidoacrylate peracid hydrolase